MVSYEKSKNKYLTDEQISYARKKVLYPKVKQKDKKELSDSLTYKYPGINEWK